MSTTRNLDPCGSYLVQKYVHDPGNGKCHKLQKKTSQIITFAVFEQTATPNFASSLTLSVQARVCSEGKRKTSRLLWNREEGMFLSGSKANLWDLILGTLDLTRRLQWLQWLPGKAGLVSYHEGKNRPHPKCWYMNQRPQAAGHLLRVSCGSLCRNCWKLNTLGLDELTFWEEKPRMSKDCWKKHPTGIKKAVKKDLSEERSLCNHSTESQTEWDCWTSPGFLRNWGTQFGHYTNLCWRSSMFDV